MLSAPCPLLFVTVFAFTVTGTLVQPEWKIYYDVRTNQTIDFIGGNNPRIHLYDFSAPSKALRIGFGPIPCNCEDLMCGCCAGINIKVFNFDRRACMNFTYEPYDFALSVDMYMDEESLFSQSISGKNPPPACVPVPLPPPLISAVDVCVKFFNIHTPGLNLFMCMDFETRISRAPILILHFDCMKMGVDGIHFLKPEDAETEPIEEIDEGEGQLPGEMEIYDEVFEEDEKNKTMKSTERTRHESTQASSTNVSVS